MNQPDLVTVYVEQGLLRAQVIKAKLEDAGIPVLLDYESIGPIIGITVDGLGKVRVRVPAQHADAARALIEEE
jgi:hypothetical protein